MARYLFLGAHPDDIEFGAGGTLAKAIRSNIECHALVLSNCNETLENPKLSSNVIVEESTRALKTLGLNINQVKFLDFKVRHFPEARQEILQTLIDLSRVHQFERVFVPSSFDIHQDHKVLQIEALRAFKFATILGYELPWNNLESKVNYFNVISNEDLQLKKSAVSEFYSQSDRFYAKSDRIEVTLKFRGLQINKEYAEGFEVVRWIES